jgi:ubiquinone/menaquinone biosynthesis C-methylase UbiE
VTVYEQFHARKEEIRKRLLKYTRKAFRMLPRMDRPLILDIGCGSGIPTLELARLSHGEVMGIDIDGAALDEFNNRIKKTGLADRVRAINCSMFHMDSPPESFDVIWAEGSIYAIGFERGLREWRRFLKPGGFLVVHDEQGNVKEKLEQIADCGYGLLGHFMLSTETWHREYFAPLQKLLGEFTAAGPDSPELLEGLREAREELDMFRGSPERNCSVYFVMENKCARAFFIQVGR